VCAAYIATHTFASRSRTRGGEVGWGGGRRAAGGGRRRGRRGGGTKERARRGVSGCEGARGGKTPPEEANSKLHEDTRKVR